VARKLALIDFPKCRPADCKDGICVAAEACPRNLLKQENAAEIPVPDPALCRGCADCVRACPMKAVKLVSM
jgi:translation initiation factor RLI1